MQKLEISKMNSKEILPPRLKYLNFNTCNLKVSLIKRVTQKEMHLGKLSEHYCKMNGTLAATF